MKQERSYKGWQLKNQGRDNEGSHWLVVSPAGYSDHTGDPEKRIREILGSIKECKQYIDKIESLMKRA